MVQVTLLPWKGRTEEVTRVTRSDESEVTSQTFETAKKGAQETRPGIRVQVSALEETSLTEAEEGVSRTKAL